MNRNFRDYSFMKLPPAGELKETEMITEDEILKKNRAA